MKKTLLLFIVIVLFFSISACSDNSKNNDKLSINESAKKEDVNEFGTIDKFISLYNASNKNQIKNIKKMDIQDKDYRTEFRLNAFKNAVGKKGIINNSTINIVNYGIWSNDNIRFYIQTQTQKEVTEIYANIINILDSTITDKEISNSYDSLNDGYDAHISLGESNHISGYINKINKEKFEIMIDCTKLNFIH